MGWLSDLADNIKDAFIGKERVKEYSEKLDDLNREMREEEARIDAERQAEADRRAREAREEELERRSRGGPL